MAGKAKSDARSKEDGSDAGRKDGSTEAVSSNGGKGSPTRGGPGGEGKGESRGGAGSTRSAGGSKSGQRIQSGRSTSVKEKPPVQDPLLGDPPRPKRRGRKSNADKAQEIVEQQKRQRDQWEAGAKTLAPMLEGIVPIPFNIIAKKRGEHWQLKSDEVKRIAFAFAVIIEKHMPSFMFAWQEEIVLAMILSGAVMTRVAIDQKQQEKEKTVNVSPSNNGDAANGQDNANAEIAAALTQASSGD